MKPTLLVTGGTGFLGRHLGKTLSEKYNVILTGRNNKQNLLAKQITNCQVVPMDISNIESIRDTFYEYKPNFVIHAAATKFVDLAEKFPMECVDVNVIGSQNVARVSIETGVSGVIGISTDKAAPPVRNTYGLSKAIMERIFTSLNRKHTTKFTCVRYGNVAWSTGSVFTIWKNMHEKEGVIGTTGPNMTRFFFSIYEAVELVKTSLKNLENVAGKVLSVRMKSAKLESILKVWVKINGGIYKNIPGRPGERDDEYLIGELELPYTQEIIYNDKPHYLISFNEKVDTPIRNILSSANAERLDESEIMTLISPPSLGEF